MSRSVSVEELAGFWGTERGPRVPSSPKLVSFAPTAQTAAAAGGGIRLLRRKSAQQPSHSAAVFLAPVPEEHRSRFIQLRPQPELAAAQPKYASKYFDIFPTQVTNWSPMIGKCFPDYVPFIYRTGVKNENTFSVQKGRPGTSWHCPRLIWSLWLGADFLGLFSIPVFRLSQLQQSLRHVNCFMQRDNSVLWSQNRLWKLYVKLLKQRVFFLFV